LCIVPISRKTSPEGSWQFATVAAAAASE